MQNRQELIYALNRALECMWEGDFFTAESIFKQMERNRLQFPEGLFAHGSLKLTLGDYEKGWPLFQCRIATQAYLEKKVTHIQKPYWDGAISKSSTLLIHRDQGYGDIFMSARYFPLVEECVGRLIFSVPVGAKRLFRNAFPNIEIIEDGEVIPFNEVDFHLHSLSLPAVFETTLDTIPSANIFKAEEGLLAKWQSRLVGEKYKVGLCWQGNPAQERDPERSIPLMSMAPILDTKDIQFYGLQVGAGEEQVNDLSSGCLFDHLGPELKNEDVFVDVVAAMSCLDLVITVDTAIAHLAGSMGIPVWVLVGKVPYWPYLLEGEETPWYPTARIFRTTTRYEWDGVINAVAKELKKLARSS